MTTTLPKISSGPLAQWVDQADARAQGSREGAWAQERRRAAAMTLGTLSLPRRDDELWRRTDFGTLEQSLATLDPFVTAPAALSAFAAANETETDPNAPEDPNATPPTGPSADDLGAILAGATNKTVTSTQVKEIIERLAEQNPDDASLNDLADSVDDETCQDIADAANAAKSGETTDESDDDTTDTSSDGTDADGTDDTTTVVTN